MLYKVLCAALLVASGEALKISSGVSRREAVAKAASVALPFVIAPAFAEEIKYKRAGDANIYARADAGTLTAERAIKRAKSGDLADGSSATVCHMQTEHSAAFPGSLYPSPFPSPELLSHALLPSCSLAAAVRGARQAD